MKNSRSAKDKKIEDNLIKDVWNLFKIKIEIRDFIITDIQNLFVLKEENQRYNNWRY